MLKHTNVSHGKIRFTSLSSQTITIRTQNIDRQLVDMIWEGGLRNGKISK